MVAGLIGARTRNVIGESPAATAPMHEVSTFVLRAATLSCDAARLAMLLPELCIDVASAIEWRNHHIGNTVIAFGVAGLSRQLEANLAERMRQVGIADRLEGSG